MNVFLFLIVVFYFVRQSESKEKTLEEILQDPTFRCHRYYKKEIEFLEGASAVFQKDIIHPIFKGFPICIDPSEKKLDTEIAAFLKKSNSVEEIAFFEDSEFDIKLSRINVPDASVFNLRNWAHITIKSKQKSTKGIRYLILQPIKSPLGIPFGEFRTDIICKDEPKGDRKLPRPETATIKDEFVVNCKHKPRNALRYPGVYVAKYFDKGSGKSPLLNEVHVNFNWIDVMCQEMRAMQFTVWMQIGNSDGSYPDKDEIVKLLSPVYSNHIPDKLVGSPYPWHYSFKDATYCHSKGICDPTRPGCFRGRQVTREPLALQESPDKRRIIYNDEYNECIVNGKRLDKTGACPPHPIVPEQLQGKPVPAGATKIPPELPGLFTCSEDRGKSSTYNKGILTTYNLTDNLEIASETTSADYRQVMSKSWASCPYNNREKGDCQSFGEGYLEERCKMLFPPTCLSYYLEHYVKKENFTAPEPMPFQYPDIVACRLNQLLEEQLVYDAFDHGILSIAAFFVLISGSNFLARYLKETGGGVEGHSENGYFGLRCWLVGHITLGFITVATLWMAGTVPTASIMHCRMGLTQRKEKNGKDLKLLNNCLADEEGSRMHNLLGNVAVWSYFFIFATGWHRPLNRTVRWIFTALHSFCGHGLQILAFVVMWFSGICGEISYFIVALVSTSLALNVVATLVQYLMDRAHFLKPKRKLCPIAEHVVEGHCCRFELPIQLVVHWGLQIVIFFVILLSYGELATNNLKCMME